MNNATQTPIVILPTAVTLANSVTRLMMLLTASALTSAGPRPSRPLNHPLESLSPIPLTPPQNASHKTLAVIMSTVIIPTVASSAAIAMPSVIPWRVTCAPKSAETINWNARYDDH